MDPMTEALLYAAARRQHVVEKILPALKEGKIVLCDRFSDSTFVYQGSGRGVELATLRMLDDFATSNLHPDLTILLDGEPEELAIRRNARGVVDRFELEGLAFQRKIREAFLTLAANEPTRIHVIDALQAEENVTKAILADLQKLLAK